MTYSTVDFGKDLKKFLTEKRDMSEVVRLAHKIDFGQNIEKFLSKKRTIEEIAQWAYKVYLDKGLEITPEADDVIMALVYMEEGEEFEIPMNKIYEIADQLIKGEKINI